MIIFSTLGNSGFIWIVITVVLLFTKKYRECAVAIAVALLFSTLICNIALKNLVERPRPFRIDEQVILKIEEPPDYSFPSGHTFSSFAAAVALFIYSRKMGMAALALAFAIAFSRLYLFLHFPTDVLASVVLGSATAVLATFLVRKFMRNTLQKAGWIALPAEPASEGGKNEFRND